MSEIVTVPHPVLRKIAKPVEIVDKRLLDIISDMSKTLLAAKDPEGVGLAAPQVGLPMRMFLIRPEVGNPVKIFINPQIVNYSQRQQTPESKKGVYEGCLSIPYHYSPLKRSMSVTVKYQTLDPASRHLSWFPKTKFLPVFLPTSFSMKWTISTAYSSSTMFFLKTPNCILSKAGPGRKL